jgi:hypothetical protein
MGQKVFLLVQLWISPTPAPPPNQAFSSNETAEQKKVKHVMEIDFRASLCYIFKKTIFFEPMRDDFVKSPSAALRFNFVVAAHR